MQRAWQTRLQYYPFSTLCHEPSKPLTLTLNPGGRTARALILGHATCPPSAPTSGQAVCQVIGTDAKDAKEAALASWARRSPLHRRRAEWPEGASNVKPPRASPPLAALGSQALSSDSLHSDLKKEAPRRASSPRFSHPSSTDCAAINSGTAMRPASNSSATMDKLRV